MKTREMLYEDARGSGVQYFVSLHCFGFFFFYHKFFFLSNVVALENNMTLMLPRVALPDYRDAGEHRGLFFLFFLLKMTRF